MTRAALTATELLDTPPHLRPTVRVLHGVRETFGRITAGVAGGRVWVEIPAGDVWLTQPFDVALVLAALSDPTGRPIVFPLFPEG